MNCVEIAIRHCRDKPNAIALWLPGHQGGSTTFSELEYQARQAQKFLLQNGLRPAETVLLVDELGPRLYAVVMAVIAMGASIMLVEPWMPMAKIEHAVTAAKPRIFLSSCLGKLWGIRIPAIRHIRRWLSITSINKVAPGPSPMLVESVAPSVAAILTFTSGTTGLPKGVVRNQDTLFNQHRILEQTMNEKYLSGPDLCIFANFVLHNLASGRCSIIIPPIWKTGHLKQLDQLPQHLIPQTLTCGPGFLLSLMNQVSLPSLKSINVGGALTDCRIFEKGFDKWPDCHWLQVYGTTEAEPVAVCDAKTAVKKSRERGFFQTLYLGNPIDAIETEIDQNGLWVTGPHVCPHYLGSAEEDRLNKKEDNQQRVWNFMGDRVRVLDPSEGGWWYSGRASQPLEDFELEQLIYTKLHSSKAFLHRSESNELYLLGEDVRSLSLPGDETLRSIKQALELHIYRDQRHHARINRNKSLIKGAKWLLG